LLDLVVGNLPGRRPGIESHDRNSEPLGKLLDGEKVTLRLFGHRHGENPHRWRNPSMGFLTALERIHSRSLSRSNGMLRLPTRMMTADGNSLRRTFALIAYAVEERTVASSSTVMNGGASVEPVREFSGGAGFGVDLSSRSTWAPR